MMKKIYSDSNAPGISAMWKYSVLLNKKAREIVLAKFNTLLLDLAYQENIRIQFFKTKEELNNACFPSESESDKHSAIGVYTHIINKVTRETIYDDLYPCISLTFDYNVYTLAHELGHHFAYKNFKDRSEYIANSFIQTLAEQLLTNLERYILCITLEAHSNIPLPYPEITKKEWKEFTKKYNINATDRN